MTFLPAVYERQCPWGRESYHYNRCVLPNSYIITPNPSHLGNDIISFRLKIRLGVILYRFGP